MDGQRFDALTKVLAAESSRRQLFRALGTGLAGALAGAVGLRAAEAKPKGGGRCTPAFGACPASRPCCDSLPCAGGVCCPPGHVCGGACCPPGQVCTDQGCCPEVQACGTTCLSAPCDAGACQRCDSTTGTCVSTCAADQACVGGICGCTSTSCPSGCCDANGTCQVSSNATCGVGGAACAPCGVCQTCSGGACIADPGQENQTCCPPGGVCGLGSMICCGGQCIANDDSNCGTCGNACRSDQTCCPGVLVGASKECASRQSICGGGCNRCFVNQVCCGDGTCSAKDLSNCCGAVCPTIANAQVACDVADDTGETGCVYQCNDFYGNCDGDVLSNGCETYLLDNPDHCGFCGVKCDTTIDPDTGNPKEKCAGCRCVPYAFQGQIDCDPACASRCYSIIR